MIRLLPFQNLGRDFLCLRNRALLADDMGLGKTFQAIEAAKKLRLISGLIVCPQSIRRNWVKRLREQCPDAFIKEIFSPKIIPEPNAFNVVNYDIVWKEPLIRELRKIRWQVMILDESHFLRNIEAKRTKTILGRNGLYNQCDRIWAMTGTPILNRPIELFPLLRSLFPQLLHKYQGYYEYAYHFCAAYQDTFGFNCTGASNLSELSKMLSNVMLRRLKSEVQAELPGVFYEKIYLDPTDKLIALTEQENKLAEIKQLAVGGASIRKAIGVIKCAAAVKHLQEIGESKDKILVFAWHHDVIEALTTALPESVRFTGRESAQEKDAAIAYFRNEPKCKYFIANIQSAAFGVDGLQDVCDTCVFVEMDYVPEIIRQAVDRLNRIGQTRSVLAQFLVAEGSQDEKMIDTLVGKSKNINIILDERRSQNAEFIEAECNICKNKTEMTKLKRVAGLSVCENCTEKAECLT